MWPSPRPWPYFWKQLYVGFSFFIPQNALQRGYSNAAVVPSMERHDCLKDNVIDSCCACYILCRWIVILCCHHVVMSCARSILCRWIVRLCCIHVMMSCAYSILCRWVVILCCHHVMMSCACSILCRWIVRLCCLYIMMSCAFSISCRWVVVLCWQNNIIILCCHHTMTSCASFILCCWVTMLYWMFGTDLIFGTNELPVDKVLYFRLKSCRYCVTSVFCSFDSSPATLQPEELADFV